MKRLILILSLLVTPAFAQRPNVDNLKAFRQDLAAAVQNGNLTADEKQKYDAALKKFDDVRTAKKSGSKPERGATREALRDLITIAKSENLKEEDRAKLAKHMDKAREKRK
ncbi:MAG: hypothetical protein FJW30_30520 [Acidobacteria bacterium]|nr:hypothetical protein [Acidobacteriota bacterium]